MRLLLTSLLLAPTALGAQAPAAQLTDFAWLAGTRQMARANGFVEEHWTAATANVVFGVSRTVRGDRVVEFEFIRIEQRPEGIFYVAQPNGRPPTLFKLTRWDGTEAVFENPEHDFPKRVVYRRLPDNVVWAKVDAGEGSRGPEFTFRPVPPPR